MAGPVMIGRCDPTKKQWWVFFLSSVITLIGGVLIVLVGRLVALIHKKITERRTNQMKKITDTNREREKEKDKLDDIGWVTSMKDWAGELISGQTTSGRILVGYHHSIY